MKFTHDPSVKFLYLQNKKDPEQVLCVGRVIRDGQMILSTSLNHWSDRFDKAKARHIASERIKLGRNQVYTIPVPPQGQKTEAIIRFLSSADTAPHTIRKIAKQYS